MIKERDRALNKENEKNNYVTSSKEVKFKQIQCFKCLEKWYYASECPKKGKH